MIVAERWQHRSLQDWIKSMLILPTLLKSVLAGGLLLGLISTLFAALTKSAPLKCCALILSN